MVDCGYCADKIAPGEDYTYQYFPEKKKYLTVHNYHLRTVRKKKLVSGETND